MGFSISSGNEEFRVTRFWWHTLSYCSDYIDPSIAATCPNWYWNCMDGVSAAQARELGDALQCAMDDGRIDKLARELFVVVHEQRMVEDLGEEREFVDIFISEVVRWIEFLKRCNGFTIW